MRQLWLAIAIVAMFLVPGVGALDTTATWATTTDWDRGTKTSWYDNGADISKEADDVYALETTAENPAALDNRLSPASVYGDDFRNTSLDGKTFRFRAPSTGCTNTGTITVSTGSSSLSSETLALEDGALVFRHSHGPGTTMNSTRSTPAPVAGAGSFTWTGRVGLAAFTLSTAAETNLTVGLLSIVSADPATSGGRDARVLCGGFNTSSGAEGGGFWITGGQRVVGLPLARITAFLATWNGSATVLTTCGLQVGWTTGPFTASLRIVRFASRWTFYVGTSRLGECSPGYGGPVFLSLDLKTTDTPGALVAFHEVASDWLRRHPSESVYPPYTFLAGIGAPESRWTSEVVGSSTDRAIAARITFIVQGHGGGYCVETPALLTAAGVVIESFASLCSTPTEDAETFVRTYTITSTTRGPFRWRTGASSSSTEVLMYVARIELDLTDSSAGPTPPDPLNRGLTPLLGNLFPCGIFAVVVVAVGAFAVRWARYQHERF